MYKESSWPQDLFDCCYKPDSYTFPLCGCACPHCHSGQTLFTELLLASRVLWGPCTLWHSHTLA